jgi:hypothetical protein
MVLALFRQPRRALVFVAFPVAYFAVAGSLRNLYFRYVIPLVPFVCVAAAYLVSETAIWLAKHAPATQRRMVTTMTTAALAILVIVPSAASLWRFDRIVSRTDSRVMVAEWLEQHAAPGSSVLQSGSRYGLAQFPRRLRYVEWVWDGTTGIFRVAGQPATGEPDWIVVQDSPLPSTTQDVVKTLLSRDYDLAMTIEALSLNEGLVYDRMDMFYVPFDGLEWVNHPGPNFAIYARRSAPSHADAADARR